MVFSQSLNLHFQRRKPGLANGEFRRPIDSKNIELAGLENLFAGRWNFCCQPIFMGSFQKLELRSETVFMRKLEKIQIIPTERNMFFTICWVSFVWSLRNRLFPQFIKWSLVKPLGLKMIPFIISACLYTDPISTEISKFIAVDGLLLLPFLILDFSNKLRRRYSSRPTYAHFL